MKEIYPERDTLIKDFTTLVGSGAELPPTLQEEFLKYTRQISARKCLKMGYSGDKLDDLVSDACLSFYQAIVNKKYKVTDSPVAAYISKVTRNEIVNKNEKQNSKNNWVEKQINEMKLPRSERPVEEEVLNRESLRIIADSIESLSKKQKEVIILISQEYTRKEICNSLNITEYELNNRLYRARKKIKSILT